MSAAFLAMLLFSGHSQGCGFFWVLFAKWKCGSLASVVGIKETQGYSDRGQQTFGERDHRGRRMMGVERDNLS